MQPRKDYEDYLRFVNDTYSAEMVDFMNTQSGEGKGPFGNSSRNSLLPKANDEP